MATADAPREVSMALGAFVGGVSALLWSAFSLHAEWLALGRRGSYGVDAPFKLTELIRNALLASAVSLLLLRLTERTVRKSRPIAAVMLFFALFAGAQCPASWQLRKSSRLYKFFLWLAKYNH